MNELLRRLEVIHKATGAKEEKPEKSNEKLDEFRRTKRDIARAIKEIRQTIKERDELLEKQPGTKHTVELSAKVRSQIRAVREEAGRLNALQRQEAKKRRKSPEQEAQANNRKEMVELVFKHIEECEAWEKRRFTDKHMESRTALFSGGGGGAGVSAGGIGGMTGSAGGMSDPTMSELPDLETRQGLDELATRNKQIDSELAEVGEGILELKAKATAINEEVDNQIDLVDDVTGKVDKAAAHMVNINTKMKKTLENVRSGDRFVVDFILLIVLLGIVGYIYQTVASSGE